MKRFVSHTSKLATLFLVVGILGIGCQSQEQIQPTASTGSGNTSSPAPQEKMTVKISHEATEDMTKHQMFLKFKDLLETGSNGKFTVEIYPNAQLAGDVEAVESTQAGDITIAAPSTGILSNFSTALQVFDLPFIFKDTNSAYEVFDGPVGTELLKDLENSGLVGLGFSENGWRQLTTAKGPITSPDQMKGVKLRTMKVPIHLSFWEDIGANPTPMAFTEVFTALSQGVIDGEENPLQIIHSMKFYEPNKYITMTGHIFDPEPIVISKKFFDGLSADDQQLFRDAAKQSIDYQRELNKDLDSELRKKLTELGAVITDLTPEQRTPWMEKVRPTYEEYVDKIGREKVLKVLEAAGNDVISKFIQ